MGNIRKPSHKIFIVEDDPAMLGLLETCLDGYQLFAASSIKEALEKLKKIRPDLVIMDRGLPDGDGIMLCAEIRKDPQYRSMPVLMLTAKAEIDDKVLGRKLGADDYLAKPFMSVDLKIRVEALLNRTDEEPKGLASGFR